MYKATIEYKDYFDNNEKRVEDMYFNINAFELSEIMLDFGDEGLGKYMERHIKEGQNSEAFKVLKMLFVTGYGRRQEIDGRPKFIKKPEWILELLPSPEFEAFYLRLSSDTEFAISFWKGIVTEDLLKKAEQVIEIEGLEKKQTGEKKFRDMTLEEQVAALQAKVDASEAEKKG